MRWELIVGAFAVVFLLTVALAGHAQNSNAGQSDAGQVIEVTAQKYGFSPNEIRVKKGHQDAIESPFHR